MLFFSALKQGSLSPIKKIHIDDKNFTSSTKNSLGMIQNVYYLFSLWGINNQLEYS